MLDGYHRSINYLRISVTDRCNFRCVYCMPPQGKKWLNHSDILTYEEILHLITVFSREGIDRIRLTGGEPLMRLGFVDFVAAVRNLGVIKDLSMTTNASLLPPVAADLKAAGLNRVNISLDTINPVSFARITTCGRLEDTLAGIESSLEAGLTPVKLNVVLTEALNEKDLAYFIELVYNKPISVRFIEYMPIGGREGGGYKGNRDNTGGSRDSRDSRPPRSDRGERRNPFAKEGGSRERASESRAPRAPRSDAPRAPRAEGSSSRAPKSAPRNAYKKD